MCTVAVICLPPKKLGSGSWYRIVDDAEGLLVIALVFAMAMENAS